MPVQATSIADVIISSQNELGRGKLTDVSSDYRETIALKRVFAKKKATKESGPEIQFNLLTGTNGAARHVPLGYTSNVDIVNTLAVGKMPWRHTTTNYAMERRVIQMNSGAAKIVDEVKKARLGGIGSLIELMERTLWRCPNVTTEFDLHPVGIPYFVVKSATAATVANNNGFNGLVPANYTLVANINPTTGASGRWKNYTDAYTDISKTDLVPKMRRAARNTKFKALVDGTPEYATGNDRGIYTNQSVTSIMEELLEDQNDNLGNDIASKDGMAVFHRTEIEAVQELDADTTNPVYMLDWKYIGAMALKNEWMKEELFDKNPNQPTMIFTNIDCTWNLWCTDRRKQAVLSNGTTMPA